MEDTNTEDPDSFSLIWLDDPLHYAEETAGALKELQSSIHQLKTFDNDIECEEDIQSLSAPSDRFVLLINCRWASLVIPRIHDLRQISSIYIHCIDKQSHEGLTKEFSKV